MFLFWMRWLLFSICRNKHCTEWIFFEKFQFQCIPCGCWNNFDFIYCSSLEKLQQYCSGLDRIVHIFFSFEWYWIKINSFYHLLFPFGMLLLLPDIYFDTGPFFLNLFSYRKSQLLLRFCNIQLQMQPFRRLIQRNYNNRKIENIYYSIKIVNCIVSFNI